MYESKVRRIASEAPGGAVPLSEEAELFRHVLQAGPFGDLSSAVVHELASEASRVDLNSFEVLQDAGRTSPWVHFIASGLVAVSLPEGGNEPVEIHTLGVGDCAGILNVFWSKRMAYRMTVRVPGTAFRLQLRTLQQLAERDRSVREALRTAFGAMIMRQSQMIACNAKHSVNQRLARWLLTASDQMRSPVVEITHNAIAQSNGVRRAGTTQFLSTLQRAGIAQCTRGRVRILDRAGLEALSCSCYVTLKDTRMPRRMQG